jgi:7-carboxy-7-deazaguanine synthase
MLKVVRKTAAEPEIFFSIQGEGANIGRPAVFLRLALCNLKCVWCDTRYAWDWQQFDSRQNMLEMPVESVETQILAYKCRYVVITGGEPLIQKLTLIPLLERLKSAGFYVEIETNGTLNPGRRLRDIVDHWSVSPKLASSGNPLPTREKPGCYGIFATHIDSHFKFVIQDEADLTEALKLIKKYRLPAEKIIFMPEAKDKGHISAKSRWLVEQCKEYGFRFSPRLHILLWGNKRGK